MLNMSYCRFRNTLKDLRDCADNWDVESDEEAAARRKLFELCAVIAADYSDSLDFTDEDSDEEEA